MRLILFLGLILSTSCGPGTNPPTTTIPTPPQSIDLKIATSLLTAQTAIEQAKGLVTIKPQLKDPLNAVIGMYNNIETLYLVFHNDFAAGKNPDPTAILAQTNTLAVAVNDMIRLFK